MSYTPPPRDRQFSTRPFFAGELTGIRCWGVSAAGQLFPANPWPNSPWQPGENVAVCHRQWSLDQETTRWVIPTVTFQHTLLTQSVRIPLVAEPTSADLRPKVPEHPVASLDCSCGFYAFFDTGDNQYDDGMGIYGLVEGYGVLTVGERGFRASKARIKALIAPGGIWYRAILMDIAANYHVPIFATPQEALARFPLTRPDDLPSSGSGYTFAGPTLTAGES